MELSFGKYHGSTFKINLQFLSLTLVAMGDLLSGLVHSPTVLSLCLYPQHSIAKSSHGSQTQCIRRVEQIRLYYFPAPSKSSKPNPLLQPTMSWVTWPKFIFLKLVLLPFPFLLTVCLFCPLVFCMVNPIMAPGLYNDFPFLLESFSPEH